MPSRPHLAWPIAFDPAGNGYAMVEQDSEPDIAGCIATGVLWPLGTRDLDVDFGNLDPLGSPGANLDAIRRAALYADARAGQLDIVQDDTALGAFVARVQVGFTGPAEDE